MTMPDSPMAGQTGPMTEYDYEDEALWDWVDRIADQFEVEWERGGEPRIADFVKETEGAKRAVLLRELARIDCERRKRTGAERPWESYVEQYPELRATAAFGPESPPRDTRHELWKSDEERSMLPQGAWPA